MTTKGPIVSAFVFVAILACTARASAVIFSTLAGSGSPGVTDGLATQASFLLPYGVAVGQDGTIYVSDYLGQRIRAITRNGWVRTVAGGGTLSRDGLSVQGAYADGVGPTARFNGPAGLAFDATGRLFVADSKNRAIRVVDVATGKVGTYSGGPNFPASDGGAALAGYSDPRALAFDSKGTLWVADGTVGLRRIADGAVKTLSLPTTVFEQAVPSALHLTSILPTASGSLMLCDGVSMLEYDPANPAAYEYSTPAFTSDTSPPHLWYGSGRAPAGYPFGIASLGPNAYVYTDPVLHAIRLRLPRLNVPLTRAPRENDDITPSLGFADGTSGVVDAPLGIAALGSDSVVFADSGNRRVRVVSGIVLRHFVPPDLISDPFGPYADGRKYYRILFVGNSELAARIPFPDTAAGRVETLLNAHRSELRIAKPVKVALVPFGTVGPVRDYISNVVSAGIADAVVWEFNAFFVSLDLPGGDVKTSPMDYVAQWKDPLTQKLAAIRASLKEAKVAFYVAAHPTPYDLPPLEETWTRLVFATEPDQTKFAGEQQLFASLFAPEGSHYLDLWPAFLAAESSSGRQALYSSSDFHMTAYGQAVVGEAIYRELADNPPWPKAPSASRATLRDP